MFSRDERRRNAGQAGQADPRRRAADRYQPQSPCRRRLARRATWPARQFAQTDRDATQQALAITVAHPGMNSAAFWVAHAGARSHRVALGAGRRSRRVYMIHNDLSRKLESVAIFRTYISAGRFEKSTTTKLALSDASRARQQQLVDHAFSAGLPRRCRARPACCRSRA